MSGVLLPPFYQYWWIPNPIGSGWIPATGYFAAFYGAGLDPIAANYKTIYDEIVATSPIANPVEFDTNGTITVVLGTGGYKEVIWDRDPSDPDAVAVRTFDNISGDSSFGTGFVENNAALRALTTFTPGYTYMAGYYENGDGGEGMFYWDAASSLPDDGGYTIIPDTSPANGRWRRIPDEDGNVRAAAFGVIPSKDAVLTTELENADVYATSIGARLLIQAGSVAQYETFTFSSPYVQFAPGAEPMGVLTPTCIWTFNGLVEGDSSVLFVRMTVALSVLQVSQYPEWFGVSRANDDVMNVPLFAKWITAGGGAFILPTGGWNYTDPSTFPWPDVPFTLLGILVGNGNPNYGPGFHYPDDAIIRIGTFESSNGYGITAYSTTGLITNGVWVVSGNEHIMGNSVIDDNVLAENAIISNDVNAGQDVNADRDNTSGRNVSAYGNVVAGNTLGSPGFLVAQAGTSSTYLHANGLIGGGIRSQTISTTPLVLTAYAQLLNSDNDQLIYEAAGTMTAFASITLSFGGTTITTVGGTTGSGSPARWTLRVIMVRISSSSLLAISTAIFNEPALNSNDIETIGTLDFTVLNSLSLAATTGTTVCEYAAITFQPASPQ